MNVTKLNVADVGAVFAKMLEECDFVAIDTEISGIPKGRPNPCDTPEQRYVTRYYSSRKYLVVQYGICGFKFDAERNKYVYYPFNFYVFPSTHGLSPDADFNCLPSSLAFLAGCGFDFNKVVTEGVPFIRADHAEACRKKLAKMQEAHMARVQRKDSQDPVRPTPAPPKEPEPRIPVPERLAARVSGIMEDVTAFVGDAAVWSLEIRDCRNPFLRKLVYQEMEHDFPDLIVETVTQGGSKDTMLVSKGSKSDSRRFEHRFNVESEQLETEVGFTKFVLKLAEADKPVVGHNILLDLSLTLGQFCQELPPTLAEFKTAVRKKFGRVFDTKVLGRSEKLMSRIPSTILGDLIKILTDDFVLPEMEPMDGFPKYELESEGDLHEAGYDAFVTGVSFIGMAIALGAVDEETREAGRLAVDLSSPLLDEFCNKCNSMIADIPCFDLERDEVVPDRSHVFHLTFPSEYKTSDIQRLFEPCGKTYVSWLDDTSALVRLLSPEKLSNFGQIVSREDVTVRFFRLRLRGFLSPYVSLHLNWDPMPQAVRDEDGSWSVTVDERRKSSTPPPRPPPCCAVYRDVSADFLASFVPRCCCESVSPRTLGGVGIRDDFLWNPRRIGYGEYGWNPRRIGYGEYGWNPPEKLCRNRLRNRRITSEHVRLMEGCRSRCA